MTLTQGIILAAGIIAGALLGVMLARRVSLPGLPPWSWRNIIALVSLAASIIGAAVITLMIWAVVEMQAEDADRLIAELVRDPKARPEVGQVLVAIYDSLGNNLIAWSLGLLAILIGFGFAITARKFEGEIFGTKLKWSGGEEDAPPAARAADEVADAARDRADTIKQEVKE